MRPNPSLKRKSKGLRPFCLRLAQTLGVIGYRRSLMITLVNQPMYPVKALSVISLAVAMALSSVGCASTQDFRQGAAREQRAADALRTIGAGEAARAAQDRADAQMKMASIRCDGVAECVVAVLLDGLFDSLLSSAADSHPRKRP